MSVNGRNRDGDRTRRLLDLVLDTGRMTAGCVDRDLRYTWVHTPDAEPLPAEMTEQPDAELFDGVLAEPTTALKRAAMENEDRVEREFTLSNSRGPTRYRAAAEPIYDADGRVDGAVFAAIDRSGRCGMLERTTDAVFTVDADWTVTFWNERMAERTGQAPSDVVGRSLWTVHGDSIPSELEARYRTVMATGEPAEVEQYLPEPFDAWVEIRVFADDAGLSVYARDVSERKAAEARVRAQRDTLEVLTGVLGHDIRNDLQVVAGYVDLIADRVDDEGVLADLATIRERTDHAYDLTTTASEVTEAVFTAPDQLKRVPLAAVLRDELENLRTAHPAATVVVEEPLSDATVLADGMLDSVFRNLLQNAVQHADRDAPTVRITTEMRGDEVAVRVADDGPGVPDDRKRAIFGRGEKGSDSRGTGIGLALVSMLVDRYGGDVEVTDNEPTGAVFGVTLPTVAGNGSGDGTVGPA